MASYLRLTGAIETYSYNIPKALPNGDYLLRIQQLAIHNPGSTPQFYLECAQVTVTNGGSGSPSPLVSIPGWIKGNEPGYTVNIYNNFHNYTIPGPAVVRLLFHAIVETEANVMSSGLDRTQQVVVDQVTPQA